MGGQLFLASVERNEDFFALESRQRQQRLKAETDTFVFDKVLFAQHELIITTIKKFYLEVVGCLHQFFVKSVSLCPSRSQCNTRVFKLK